MHMHMELLITATYKGTTSKRVAELCVKDDTALVTVNGPVFVLPGDLEFVEAGGAALLEPVLWTRISSALCTVNNLKLHHIKYRCDNFGKIELPGFDYKSGLKVRCELKLRVL